jgi:DNA-3-methyladenine glycosylase II
MKNLAPSLRQPSVWQDACRYLADRDPVIAGLVAQHGHLRIEERGDAFETLARAIVGQQISVAAARSVWQKLEKKSGQVSPERLSRMRVSTLRQCGLSERKAEYVKDLGRAFAAGEMRIADWPNMNDEDIIEELTQLRGIGRWTAEMFLIFNLLRPNVLPLDDQGLLNAVKLAYDAPVRLGKTMKRAVAEPTPAETRRRIQALCQEKAQLWQPWCSVATFLMWRSLDVVALTEGETA